MHHPFPAKQMPVIYRVKKPQEEGDTVKTLLKSDVFNGKETEKMHLRSFPSTFTLP